MLNIIPKKKISRKKPEEKTDKNYFDDNTQASIVKYQKEPDLLEKNLIYLNEILPAFDALVRNLINVYGFHVYYETKEDLKNECLEFLFGVLNKFKAEKGSKAFSYFNVIAKRWLIIKSKQNAKNIQTYVSLDNKDTLSSRDLSIIDEKNIVPSIEDLLMIEDVPKNLQNIVNILKNKVKTENENTVLKAIQILIDNVEEIEMLSKRAIMIYVRELTSLSTKQLSMVLTFLKKQYKIIKEEMNAE